MTTSELIFMDLQTGEFEAVHSHTLTTEQLRIQIEIDEIEDTIYDRSHCMTQTVMDRLQRRLRNLQIELDDTMGV